MAIRTPRTPDVAGSTADSDWHIVDVLLVLLGWWVEASLRIVSHHFLVQSPLFTAIVVNVDYFVSLNFTAMRYRAHFVMVLPDPSDNSAMSSNSLPENICTKQSAGQSEDACVQGAQPFHFVG